MKKIIVMLLALLPMAAMAQTAKFGHMDSQAIMQSMPEFIKARGEVEAETKQYENELQEMQKELQTKFEKYQAEVNESTPANMRQRREQELNDLQQRIQQAYQDNQQAYQAEAAKKMQPIMQKLQEAVTAVLKEGGYVYGLDKATISGIAINETLSTDVTAQIKGKLGIK